MFVLKTIVLCDQKYSYKTIIFVHDFPIDVETHPLPRMIKHCLQINTIFQDDGLIPKIEFENEEYKDHIEFSQNLYLKHFDKESKLDMSYEDAVQKVKARYKSKEILELFTNLGSL